MNSLLKKITRLAGKTLGWSSYEGANPSMTRQRVPGSSPTDLKSELTSMVRSELVKNSRYLAKNSGLVREMVSVMATYAVGDGLKVQPKTDDRIWAKAAVNYWDEWAQIADITGRFSLAEIQHLICRAVDEDGEIFVHMTRIDGRPFLQLIESHRIGDWGNSKTIDGISFDAYGRPNSYRVMQDDGNFIDLPAISILHIFEPERASAARGVPSLAHSINHIKDEMELLALEKHAVKDHADKSFAIRNQSGEIDSSDGFGGLDIETGKSTEHPHSDPTALQRIVGGKWVALAPGEDLMPFESNRPSPTFTGFLEHLRRDSALGGIPYEFTADPTDVGGASVRLVVAKADRKFNQRQNLLIQRFLFPVWKFVIGDAIANRTLPAIPEWWKISVVTPRRVTVDAGREAQQNRADVEMGLKTLSDHFNELGADFGEEIERRAADAKLILETATKYGVPVEMLWKVAGAALTPTTGRELAPIPNP
jgi:lambda family phage portal protein